MIRHFSSLLKTIEIVLQQCGVEIQLELVFVPREIHQYVSSNAVDTSLWCSPLHVCIKKRDTTKCILTAT